MTRLVSARAALVLMTLFAPMAARGARLPEWAQAIADAAPPLEAGVPKHKERVLLSETRLAVAADGSVRLRHRFATQALSARSQGVGIGQFSFDGDAKLSVSKAWHVPSGERTEKSRGPAVDVTFDDAFLTDQKARIVAVDGVKKGSLVFFEFEATDSLPVLAWHHLFFNDVSVLVERFQLEVPAGWTVRHAWTRPPGVEPSVTGLVRTWEMRDLVPAEDEPLAPSPAEVAPLLVVGFTPPAGASVSARGVPDWASFASWWEVLAKDRHAVGPAVASAARTALDGVGTDPVARIRAAASYVRDHVRYVAKEIGVGGYQPRSAAQVLAELYGDCKDKGTLLRAILAADGRTSYPILVHATREGTVSDEVPSPASFNHFVVGVLLPPDAAVPAPMRSALLDAGDLGRLLVVDTTDESLSPGAMSAGLAGKRALVVAGARSRIVTLPVGDPAAHRVERRLEARVHEDRSIAMQRTTRWYGASSFEPRAAYRSSSMDRRREVERDLTRRWVGSAVQDYAATFESEDGAFVETVSWNVPAAGGASLHPVFPGASEDLPRVSLTKRRTPVRYPYPVDIKYEVLVEGLPFDAVRFEPEHREGDGWQVDTTFGRETGGLRASWAVSLSRQSFEPDRFADLKAFWSAAGKAAGILVPLGP